MASELQICVGEEHFSSLPIDVINKIESHLSIRQSTNDELTAKIDTLRADYEQKCYELDKKIIETSTALERESSNAVKLAQENDKIQSEADKLKEENTQLKSSVHLAQTEITVLKREKDALQEEKLSIQHILQKRETDLERSTCDWKTASDKLNKAINAKNEMEIKLDESCSNSMTFDYEQKKIQQEKELLEKQVQQLTNELQTVTTEASAVKLERSGELINLKGKLEEKMSECNLISVNLNSLRKTNSEYQDKINELLERNSKIQEEHASMEELYRNELQSQTKLAGLYKSSAEEATAKADELSSAVSEVQRLILSSSEANAIAQQQINELEIKNTNLVRETESLKKELEKANDLLTAQKSGRSTLSEDELNKLCPTAAMASKFMKSGMTLTEIYSKYIEVSDDLDTVKLENKRLNEAMDAILSELNEKAPVLKQQREDYERALATISQLTSQMDNAVIECQHLQTKTDDALRKYGLAQRDNGRLQQETVDMSKQIQFLLKEISELKGGTISMDQSYNQSMQEDELSSSVITSSDVISSQLLTFKDINGLQQQNKKLLTIIHEFTDEKEKEDAAMTNERVKELSNMLDNTKEELDAIKNERVRQADLVEALVNQRDMYRVLIANDPHTSIPPTILASPSLLSKSPNKSSSINISQTTDDTVKALNSLQEEFNTYKIQNLENIKIYKEQIDKLQSEVSELRSSSAKFQAFSEFQGERANILKQNNHDLKNENKILKDKSNQQLMLVQKQELTLVDTCDKLSNLEQAKAKTDAQLESIKSENNLLKRTEDRLRSEISFLSKEQRGQSVLLANLQKIQQTVERQEFEVRSQMRQQIESQEQELKASRKNMNDLTDEKQQSVHTIEKQLLLVQSQYEKQCEISEETSQKLKAEIEKYQTCDFEKNQLQAKLSSIEKRMKNLSDLKGMSITVDAESNDDDTLKDLQSQYEEMKDELAAGKQKLERANTAILQQKAIAAAAEESMKQANQSNKELSDALNSRLSTANEQIVRVEQKVAKLHSDNLKLSSNKSDLINEVDRQTEGLNKQIAMLQTELEETLNRLKVAQKCEQEARAELQEQALAAKEANDSYQREMILHGTDMQQLRKLKEASNSYQKRVAELKTKLQESQAQFNAQKEMTENYEAKYKAEICEIKERSDDLEKQNTVLHERIEYLSKQLTEAQQNAANIPSYLSPVKKMPSAYGDEDDRAKSDDQLMDIVKYLRKEKMLFETKFDVAETESKRLRHQVQSLETQVQILQKKLDGERKKSETLAQKEAEYEAVVKKIETLNVLTDSNRLLRDERDRVVGELNKMSDLLEEVQKKIAPLQQENRNLSMQNNNMKTEKIALEQDVQRWQQRAQSLTSSKRQDPEEYKKLMIENKKLLTANENLDKEVQNAKGEVSTANNLVRNLETQLARQKAERTGINTKLSTAEKELEEKGKTINQIRRVGRRYKQLYEDLQKKTQEAEKHAAAKTPETSEKPDQKSEDSAKLNLVEASLMRANAAKVELQKQLTAANQTIEENDKKIGQLTKELDEAKQSVGTTSSEELDIIKNERDGLRKAVNDKKEESKKLLTLAKSQIEKIRKELSESNNEKMQLKVSETKLKNQVEVIKQAEIQATEELQVLQKRIEDLQKQLHTLTSQQQVKLGNEARSRQIPQYSASSVSGDRKAANVRPISTTLVSQVSPLRVTRTARIMPEPQQEIVEEVSIVTQEAPRESSPPTLVSTSHVSTVPSVVSSVIPQSSTQPTPTRALVHPTRHPRVSTATPSLSTDAAVRIETQQSESQASIMHAEVRRSNEVSYTAAPSSSTGPSAVSTPLENDQAIVSSSDDQPIFHEEEASMLSTNQPASTSTSEPSQQAENAASDSAPSSSMTKIFPNRSKPLSSNQDLKLSDRPSDMTATSSDSKVAVAPVQSVQDRKRTHEDSNDDVITASSSDAQSSIPLSKRQRNSPDQSSESILESHSASSQMIHDSATSQSTQPEPSVQNSGEAIITEENSARVQPIRPVVEVQGEVSSNQFPATSSFQLVKAASSNQASASCVITTSEDQTEEGNEVDNAIVISSDEESQNNEMENNEAEQNEPYYGEEYQDGMFDEVSGSNQTEVVVDDQMELAQNPISQQVRPTLVINPPPPETVPRNRLAGRPAPLTPGLVPPTSVIPSDDGDGIVPCTPTLPAHTHDDNYQTINSPRVPSGPPIQFRFEDVSVPGQSSFGTAQRGLGSAVDNTIMDLGGTEEEPPQTIPSLDIFSSDTETNLYTTRPMVTSSFAEDIVVEEKTGDPGEEGDPEEEGRECSSSEIPVSNLQNIRGRRIRLIKSRPKGKGGGNSPTSNN